MTETPDLTGHWEIDPAHSRLGFSTRHAMVSRVRGAFNEVSGTADITEDLSDSTATVVIETASLDTRSADRDNHLRSADFFDVETYPEIRFVSSTIDELEESSFGVTGELNIRDVTNTVAVPLELNDVATDPFGNLRTDLEGTRRIDRKDGACRGIRTSTQAEFSSATRSPSPILSIARNDSTSDPPDPALTRNQIYQTIPATAAKRNTN